MAAITADQFRQRFVALILEARDLPKKPLDRHILWYSAALGLQPGRAYSEAAVNAGLRGWAGLFGGPFGLDHVTLRRFLVDEGYLRRDPAGGSYSVMTEGLPYSFDPSLAGMDLAHLVREAKQERESRKRRFVK